MYSGPSLLPSNSLPSLESPFSCTLASASHFDFTDVMTDPQHTEAFLSDPGYYHHSVPALGVQTQSYDGSMSHPVTVPRYLPSNTSYTSSEGFGTSGNSYSCTSVDNDSVFEAAPSMYSQSSNPTTIFENRSSVGNPVRELPCDFVGWGTCNRSFPLRRRDDWLAHVRSHLKNEYPRKVMCWFCSELFDAGSQDSRRRRENFERRMNHIYRHISEELVDPNPDDIRPDWYYAEHLYKHHLITVETYNQAKAWRDSVQYPNGSVSLVHEMSGIHHPSFVPPSREAQRYSNAEVIIAGDRERRRHRSHHHRH